MTTPDGRDGRDGHKRGNMAEESARRQIRAALRLRGWLKVVFLTIAMDQLLTAIFGFVAQMIDPALTQTQTVVFSCVTCMLLSNWLVTDARLAWTRAKKDKRIGTPTDATGEGSVVVDARCPRRWLVILHLELNPELAIASQ